MRGIKRWRRIVLASVALSLTSWGVVRGASHTWDVSEVFSNADGTIQFIELKECCGGVGETGVCCSHNITSTTNTYPIPAPNLTGPTSFKNLLFATPAFAATPGVPTPDYVFPAGSVPFFSAGGDTIGYTPYDLWTFGALVPTDGVNSLNRNLTTGCNTPMNYAGQTATINFGCGTLGDVDGSGTVDGGDIAGFIRTITGNPELGDQEACAEYCLGSVADTVDAFVADVLN